MGRKRIIGITGGLATGKTTVADLFVRKGAEKIDADQIAHVILQEDERIKDQVVEMFGEDILTDGAIDRRKLAGKAFFDKGKLDDLCWVMHPAIIQKIKDKVALFEEGVIVIDAPLLMEAGIEEMVDIVVVVTTSEKTQIERAAERGVSQEEAKSIIANQMPLSEKAKHADYVIDNSGGMKKIKEGVDRIWKEK